MTASGGKLGSQPSRSAASRKARVRGVVVALACNYECKDNPGRLAEELLTRAAK